MSEKLFTTQEVANMLKVNVQTVRRYIREGKLKARTIAPNLQRIPEGNIKFLFKEE